LPFPQDSRRGAIVPSHRWLGSTPPGQAAFDAVGGMVDNRRVRRCGPRSPVSNVTIGGRSWQIVARSWRRLAYTTTARVTACARARVTA
ncbi:MAG: hypothetical protein ACO3FE_22565, partial [Planctomycetaceae bacterium]